MKISVLTPSNREKEGLEIIRKCLKKQIFKDFEWIIGAPIDPKVKEAIWVQDKPKTHQFWPLNSVYNEMIKASKGELIVSIQDYIWFDNNALEKFWIHYQENPKSCVSGTGHIYQRLSEYGKPEVQIWSDPRKGNKNFTYYECFPNDLEMNFCSFPRKALYEIGGMDEYLDSKGYDVVNINVSERLDALGYKFYLDHLNECRALKHGDHPKDWDKNLTLFNGEYEKRKKSGAYPVLHYL